MADRIKLFAISEVVLAIILAVAFYYFGDTFLADKAIKELQDGEWIVVATGWGILLEMWTVIVLFGISFAIMFFFISSYLVGRKRSKRLRLKRSKSTK